MKSQKFVRYYLRESEKVVDLENCSFWKQGKIMPCFLALISSDSVQSEFAQSLSRIFVFKKPKMFKISGKLQLELVYPVTKELKVKFREQGFSISWLDHIKTQLEIKSSNVGIVNFAMQHIEELQKYQREKFHSGASTHKWIWYYESAIPAQIKGLEYNTQNNNRDSVPLDPKHFGKDVMNCYIQQQLGKRKDEFTQVQQYTMFVGTWNCGGTAPIESLSSWLACNGYYPKADGSGGPELIAIGLQETCSLNAVNILGNKQRTRGWSNHILEQSQLFFGERYKIVTDCELVGLFLVVLAKPEVKPMIKDIQNCLVKLGFKGYAGNKGAVGIRFKLMDSTLCFVNCHLVPHTKAYKDRNKNIVQISKKMNFQMKAGWKIGMYEHDQVYFLGDLNYRFNKLNYDQVDGYINQSNWQTLQQYDQLKREQKKLQVLSDFNEGSLEFPPTFKYLKGTNNYVPATHERARDPAWCDRILWRGEDVGLIQYNAIQEILQSDHKPVYGLFCLGIFKVLHEIREQFLQEIYNQINYNQGRQRPKVQFSTQQLIFETVYLNQPQTQVIQVSNIGECQALIQYKTIDGSINETRQWIFFEPREMVLNPGEIGQVYIRIQIDEHDAKKISRNPDLQDAFLVFETLMSDHHFIEIKCMCDESILKVGQANTNQNNNKDKIFVSKMAQRLYFNMKG